MTTVGQPERVTQDRVIALFQKTPFKGKCAVVTSYNPLVKDVTLEETGANTETDKQFIYNTYTELLKDVEAKPGMTKTETYEEQAKVMFTGEPANMKLLVVVDKLLTGFDAPPCTYLYIDKSMQDHGLFQAICRVNRLDGEDKDFGYIVDYKDLFKKVENAIAVYTSELDHSAGGAEPEVLLQDRLKKGKERLDNAIEALVLLCEPVEPPKGELEHIHYFCGNTEMPADLQERKPQRAALYKAAVSLVRAYANIADELEPAGYSGGDISRIRQQLDHYLNVREIIRKASGETLDLKAYEVDMRHLIDTYIEADEPRKISPFDNMGLLELIVKTGIADAITSQLGGLKIRPQTDGSKRQEIIENWYRQQLKAEVPTLIAKWGPLMGVTVDRFYVQRMKTKWGSCNPDNRSIRLNTDLARKPRECLEYLVVHEMAHLLEPTHSDRFIALMDQFMPNWRYRRDQLNQLPVRHEKWLY